MSAPLIIFDCDGVLVDSEPITNRVLAEDLTRHGLAISTEQSIELFVGSTMASVFEKARAHGADLPDDWVDRFYEIMIDTLGREVEPIPGALDVLDHFGQTGIAHCIASNGPMRKMAVTLARCGLDTLCRDRIFSAHDVGRAKPDPGLFLHAARALGHRPDACIVIEDSASGARAAAAAGMRCLGFTRDTPAAKLTAPGAQPFDDLRQLPVLLDAIL